MLTLSLKQMCRAEWMGSATGKTVINPVRITKTK